MATVEFYLIVGSVQLRLPVNPESFAYSSPFNYEEIPVEGLGDVTNIGFRGLKEFTISSFWPRDYNPSYCNYSGFRSADSFLETLERWRNGRAPVRYIVTGVKGANYLVTIRDIHIEAQRAGSPGDLYFTVTLKEFRQPNVKVVDTSKPATSKKAVPRPAPPPKAPVKSYTVKKNDSLWLIAKRVYGKGSLWPKIYKEPSNKKVIGANPNRLSVGQKLVIPK